MQLGSNFEIILVLRGYTSGYPLKNTRDNLYANQPSLILQQIYQKDVEALLVRGRDNFDVVPTSNRPFSISKGRIAGSARNHQSKISLAITVFLGGSSVPIARIDSLEDQ